MNPVSFRSQNPLVAYLDEAAASRGWTREGLSKRAGLSKDAIRSIENRGPKAAANMFTLQKLAAALEIDLQTLVALLPVGAGEPKPIRVPGRGDVSPANIGIPQSLPMDIPVRGTAAGSALGSFHIMPGIIQHVRRPPGLMTATDVYAVFVENESMYPKFAPGDLVYVSPHRPLTIGDAMIIQIKAHEHADIEAYIKIFKGRTPDYVVGEQFNPVATIRYMTNTIVATHRVVPTNELFGV